MTNTENQQCNSFSEEIFVKFLDKLKEEKISDDIVGRLELLLSNEQISDQSIKQAIFPEDI